MTNHVTKHAVLAAVAALFAVAAPELQAQTATQTVTYEVQAINQLAVTGTPSLTVTTAVAGSAPTAVTATGTYAITTNQSTRKITAAINTAMPTGLTLSVALGAPTGGTSAGTVALGTVAADVVTGISTLNASALGITYTLSATSAAGVVASSSKTVTYTITAGA